MARPDVTLSSRIYLKPSEVSRDGKGGKVFNLIDSYYDVIIPSVYAEETYYYEEENQRDLRTLYFNLV